RSARSLNRRRRRCGRATCAATLWGLGSRSIYSETLRGCLIQLSRLRQLVLALVSLQRRRSALAHDAVNLTLVATLLLQSCLGSSNAFRRLERNRFRGVRCCRFGFPVIRRLRTSRLRISRL